MSPAISTPLSLNHRSSLSMPYTPPLRRTLCTEEGSEAHPKGNLCRRSLILLGSTTSVPTASPPSALSGMVVLLEYFIALGGYDFSASADPATKRRRSPIRLFLDFHSGASNQPTTSITNSHDREGEERGEE